MAYTKAADGVTKKGKTKGKNLGDSGPTVAVESKKGSKGAKTVTGEQMRKLGRNLARAKNQG
mgnify:CR=1 FL=1|jgi:hypothetical protein